MTTVNWTDVRAVALRQPRAREDGDAVVVGRHPFVRRWDLEGRVAVQLWCWAELAPEYEGRPEVFGRVDVFAVKASVWAWLDRLTRDELVALVAASYAARLGRGTS